MLVHSSELQLVRKADLPQAEGIFISCTGLAIADILDASEQDASKPVLSANQVTMWYVLRLAGVCACLSGPGKLYMTV